MTNPAVQAEINRMVSDSAGRADLQHTAATALNPVFANVSVQGDTGDISYDSSTGQTTVHRAPKVATGAATRLPDDGRDLKETAQQLVHQIKSLEAQLAEVRYNPENGQAVQMVAGEQRRVMELQLNQLRISGKYEASRLRALAEQRAAEDAAKATVSESKLFTMGDPRKEALLREEVERERARQLAARIVRGEAK